MEQTRIDNYMDASLSPGERAGILIGLLSREEKIAQIQNLELTIGEARRADFKSDAGIGLLTAEWMSDCETIEEAAELQRRLQERAMAVSPHRIPAFFYSHGIAGAHTPGGTTFPSDLNRGANFNPGLEMHVGEIVARQLISLGVNLIVAPITDITRDYCVEHMRKTYGEARTLGIILGKAYAEGVRGVGFEGRRAEVITDSHMIDWENITDDVIEHFCLRILTDKFKVGLFEHPFAMEGELLKKTYFKDDDADVTRVAAEESLILLKNRDRILPLSRKIKKVALIGPHASDPKCYFMSEKSTNKQTATILEKLKEKRLEIDVRYAQGYDYFGDDESRFTEALEIARESDIVIMTLGMRYEFWDQELGGLDIEENCGLLPKAQENFVDLVAELQKPLVGIHFGVHPLASHTAGGKLDAILEALLPAEASADAVCDVISGKVNPGGRLSIEIYDHEDQILRRPFGFGLSFSDFCYSNIEVNTNQVHAGNSFKISLTLKNNGGIAGSELIQLYLEEENSQRKNRKLFGLRKVFFLSGEEHRIVFTVSTAQLATQVEPGRWQVEPGKYSFSVGRSVEKIFGTVTVHILDSEMVEGPERVFYSNSIVL